MITAFFFCLALGIIAVGVSMQSLAMILLGIGCIAWTFIADRKWRM